jgi:DNA-binding NarL/FixJ family response regulator
MKRPVHILLVEDHRATAQQIRLRLRAAGYASVTIADDLAGARAYLGVSACDLVLLDLYLPDGDGVELIPVILAGASRAAILVMTSANTIERVLGALRAGANGFMFKDDFANDSSALAIREVLDGRVHLSAGCTKIVVQQLLAVSSGTDSSPSRANNEQAADLALSRREREVADLARRGLQTKEIAAAIGSRPATVRNQLHAIFRKLDVSTRAELAFLLTVKWSG